VTKINLESIRATPRSYKQAYTWKKRGLKVEDIFLDPTYFAEIEKEEEEQYLAENGFVRYLLNEEDMCDVREIADIRPKKYGRSQNISGAKGEVAVCRVLGTEPDFEYREWGDGGIDTVWNGYNIDVKNTTKSRNSGFPLEWIISDNTATNVFVFCRTEGVAVEIQGWLPKREAVEKRVINQRWDTVVRDDMYRKWSGFHDYFENKPYKYSL